MPNGNMCKIGMTFHADGSDKLHIGPDRGKQHDAAVAAVIVDHLRTLADLIEARGADSGSVFDEHGRFIGRFEYRP